MGSTEPIIFLDIYQEYNVFTMLPKMSTLHIMCARLYLVCYSPCGRLKPLLHGNLYAVVNGVLT